MKELLKGRIVALDLLRGFLLCVIVIDHVARFPNPYELLTGRGILWVSAAEGFFIISGLLVGYLYTKRMKTSPRQAAFKIWKRALLLYVLSVLFTLTFTLLAWLMSANSGVKPGFWQGTEAAAFIVNLLTLQYIYGWADFLAYYAQFMLFAPLVVWLVTKRLAWLAIVASLTIWALFREQSFVLGWQVLFMLSIVAGAYLPQLEAWGRQLPNRVQAFSFRTVVASATLLLGGSAILVIALPFAVKHYLLGVSTEPASHVLTLAAVFGEWFNKEALPLPRLLAALLIFTAFYLVFRRYETLLQRKTKGALSALGQQSLFVYCLQAVLVFGINLIVPADINMITSTFLTTVVLAVLYIGARIRSRFSVRLWQIAFKQRIKKLLPSYKLEPEE